MSKWFRSTPESEALLAEERLVLAATEMVHEAMAKAGKNKQQLAGMLGVRPSEVSQRLSGRRNLTLRTLARMLHVLGSRAELELEPALPPVCAPMHTFNEVYRFSNPPRVSAIDNLVTGRSVAATERTVLFRLAGIGFTARDDDAPRAVTCNA